MSDDQKRAISSPDELLLHAYAIEREAQTRYHDLAQQMITHNNLETAHLFTKLAAIEGKHADILAARLKDMSPPKLAPWEYAWASFESPESMDHTEVHYLMHPYHALQLALKGEEQAYSFFADVAAKSNNSDIRALAEEFAEEELEHIRLVKELLMRQPKPEEGWDEDPDPPVNPD